MTLSAVIFIFLVSLTWYVLCNCLGSGAAGSEDERSLSLLNKLIGAQILVQCTEQAASSAGLIPLGAAGDKSVLVSSQQQQPEGSVQSFSSCTEERSADGTVKIITNLNFHFGSRPFHLFSLQRPKNFKILFWFCCRSIRNEKGSDGKKSRPVFILG
jgi:hypothetical protein